MLNPWTTLVNIRKVSKSELLYPVPCCSPDEKIQLHFNQFKPHPLFLLFLHEATLTLSFFCSGEETEFGLQALIHVIFMV